MEREVTCPKCRAPRTTSAAGRTLIRCAGCGERFRPAAAEPSVSRSPSSPAGDETPPPAAGPAPVAATPPASDPRIVRATKTTIKQRARPRPKASPAKSPPATPAPVDPAPPANKDRAKVVGRRGGLAQYARYTGRG